VSNSETPLLSLARSNIVRGARGLLETETVDNLVAVASSAGDRLSRHRSLELFSDLVDELFVSDAATRLHRASDLIQLGMQDNVEETLSSEDSPVTIIGGRLSDVELRVLLPYLLSQ